MQNSSLPSKLVCCSVLGLLLVTGCGSESGPERRIVTGRVTYQGAAIPSGEIRFVPLNQGPVSAARIENGAFEIDHRGGCVIGPATVSIIATPGAGNVSQDELDHGGTPPRAIKIPAEYNQKSTLRADIQSGDGKQTVDFDLSAKPTDTPPLTTDRLRMIAIYG